MHRSKNMSDDIKMEEKYAPQTKALLMIQVIGQVNVNFFNSKKLKKEMTEHLATFELEEKELLEFAEFYIDSSKSSKGYRAGVFGAVSVSDEEADTRFAKQLDELTRIIPARFGLEKESMPLRKALLQAYRKQIKNADAILGELVIDA